MDDLNAGPASPSKLPSSPSKGKGVETTPKNWRAGWWDFYPLLERPKRPLQWSQSSIIFTAHPTQPSITGRHFSSSKQFVLPPPSLIVASLSSYDPPSLISVSPGDQYLLAYFPRSDGEGVGCLWKRGFEIDNWQVKECWSLPKGGGIVAASWLGSQREWSIGFSGVPMRLPAKGPIMHVSDPTMLLVTEDNYVQIVYVRQYIPGLKTLKRSLLHSGITKEMQAAVDIGEQLNGTRQCTDASIGLTYNENSIFVATHSRRLPPPPTTSTPTPVPTFNSMDLSVNVDIPALAIPDQKAIEWENWGEERSLDVYEIQVRFDGLLLSLFVNHVSTVDFPNASLTNFAFVSEPWRPPVTPPPESDTSQPAPRHTPPDKGKVSLIINFTDFHDYLKPPTSILVLYHLIPVVKPIPNSSTAKVIIWTIPQILTTRVIDDGVVTHIEPFIDFSGPTAALLYASVLDTSGDLSKSKPHSQGKGTPIGNIKVLNLTDLSDHESWGSTVIRSSSDFVGRDLPLFAVSSPNKKMFCTLSFSLWQPSMAIYALPSLENEDLSTRTALSLATAIVGRSTTADVIHAISAPSISISEATDILYHTLEILDKYYNANLPNRSTWDIVGVSTEVYRVKAATTKKVVDLETLKSRWETAHDICSIAACGFAFESCKEKNGYDLDAVWQLIGICTWLVNFTEKLMKVCVLSSNASRGGQDEVSDPEIHPPLLHLAHPFALQNLIAALSHVKAFRDYIGSLPAGSENAHIAQGVLLDSVDCSSFNLSNLISLLEEARTSLKEIKLEDCRRALAACHPTDAMKPYLGELLQKVTKSEALLNKSALFIKPYDLVDGIARLSTPKSKKSNEKDVINKGPLFMHGPKDKCLRCGGRTVTSQNTYTTGPHLHSKWRLFEMMWQFRCVCGGLWSLSSPSVV